MDEIAKIWTELGQYNNAIQVAQAIASSYCKGTEQLSQELAERKRAIACHVGEQNAIA